MGPSTIFVQLPVVSHDFLYNLEHIPFGVGTVASYAQKYIRGINCIKLDQGVESLGCDNLILKEILKENPCRVCISIYLWNIERSLFLARRLKELSPNIEIILGGPEANPDNTYLLSFTDVIDKVIVGEGEEALRQSIQKKGPGDFFYHGTRRVPLKELPSPYETNMISPSFAGGILLEGMRGCSSRCIYCYYPKRFSKVETKPLSHIVKEIEWAVKRGVTNISFVDPSFLRRPRIHKFLTSLSRHIPRGISLYCELNAEDVDPEIALLLTGCRVVHVEVGLQSIKRETLRLIKRRFHRKRFIRGIEELRKADIRVLVDIIVGLPGDTKEDILEGIDFLIEKNLFDDIGIYPLSVLPGTALRESAQSLGLEYQKTPPYLVLKTPTLTLEDMRECMRYAEHRTSVDLYPVEFPPVFESLTDNCNLLYELLLIPGSKLNITELITLSRKLLSSVMLKIEHRELLLKKEEVIRVIDILLMENPYLLINILIKENALEGLPSNALLEFCSSIFKSFSHRSYLDRDPYSTTNIQRSIQFFLYITGKTSSSWAMVNLSEDWIRNIANPSLWLKVWGKHTSFFIDKTGRLLNLPTFRFNMLEGETQIPLIGPYVPGKAIIEI